MQPKEEKFMNLRSIATGLILTHSIAGVVLAQEPQAAAQTEVKAAVPVATVATTATALVSEKLVLREGADVNLKFSQDLSSKTATEDDPVNLVLDQDLKIGDIVIAKAGAKAVGTITHAKKAGMVGKAGELNMRLQYLIVGDTRLKLRGTKGKEGQGKEGTAVALTVLFGPIGLIKHGKNVDIKEGTPLLAYTDENFEVPASR
jgi:hypothetical protein